MDRYDPLKIEEKWQARWEKESPYKAKTGKLGDGRQKMYIAEMFPYPSGAGLHVGHVRNFTIVDALARFYAQQGCNVLRPFGYDTFGLPAENYAIKTGTSPKEATKANIDNFRKQAKRLGYAIDWDREINTSDPEYYRWTQWCFLQLYKKGLAYQKESYQWWCPVDKTVLANEQVENGCCWRCGHEVEKKKMKQWFFKITAYADELLEEIDALNWPDKIKTMQKNWIGRSQGAEVDFQIFNSEDLPRNRHDDFEESEPRDDGRERTGLQNKKLKVYTTRPDTIYGATFVVLAPEHPLIKKITTDDAKAEVEEYCKKALKKSEIERQENKEKTGVFTGAFVENPATKEKIPVWVADYVLSGYGTGAIMAVPSMDERDRAFAEKFNLPIVEADLCEFDKFGTPKTQYKMRDWLISRQRYWGCPIPIAYDKDGDPHPIPEDQLPVLIPEVEDYKPDDSGRSALAKAKDWLKVKIYNEKTGQIEEMTRETDTLDGYACSSWYLWRYASPKDKTQAWNPKDIAYWAPTDIYVGADHAVAHLLYVRFWCKFFADQGFLPFREPIKKLIYHGYINAPDGKKMSKSKGNVIDPLDVINDGYGADTLRTYEMFIGPVELDAAWDPRSVGGVYRFLNRCYTLCTTPAQIEGEEAKQISQDLSRTAHERFEARTPRDDGRVRAGLEKFSSASSSAPCSASVIRNKTIKKVTEDIIKCNFNTAVASLMEYVNYLYKEPHTEEDLIILAKLLKPFAPHLASEMLEKLNSDDKWPKWDEKALKQERVEIIVQVNGKLRAKLEVDIEDLEDEAKITEMALNNENVQKFVKTEPKKTIFVKKAKILNIVA